MKHKVTIPYRNRTHALVWLAKNCMDGYIIKLNFDPNNKWLRDTGNVDYVFNNKKEAMMFALRFL